MKKVLSILLSSILLCSMAALLVGCSNINVITDFDQFEIVIRNPSTNEDIVSENNVYMELLYTGNEFNFLPRLQHKETKEVVSYVSFDYKRPINRGDYRIRFSYEYYYIVKESSGGYVNYSGTHMMDLYLTII